ncbi:MAG: hypothetical protein ACKO4S_13625 [Snowella sp.]
MNFSNRRIWRSRPILSARKSDRAFLIKKNAIQLKTTKNLNRN